MKFDCGKTRVNNNPLSDFVSNNYTWPLLVIMDGGFAVVIDGLFYKYTRIIA